MGTRINKCLMGINYYDTKLNDIIPLESFKITITKDANVQPSNDKEDYGGPQLVQRNVVR